MNKIFKLTMDYLTSLSKMLGISYVDINVIIWFYIIPLTWAIMGDVIINHLFFIGIYGFYVIISIILYVTRGSYSYWLFYKAVQFLDYFNKFKINYIVASVIFCVLIPAMVYTILITMLLL
jgi:hypothetical protein